jgi:hypothetical protein
MIEFFEWMRTNPFPNRTWLICGKGPTFDRHPEVTDMDTSYVTLGLNHVCRNRRMNVGHIIDASALDEIDFLPERVDFFVMPWQPHFKFAPTPKTLADLVLEKPVLRELSSKGRLLWYNLCTGKNPREKSPSVEVHYFSAEAAVRLLAMAQVKKIRTLGIDGGNQYAAAFKDIAPFRGGHTTFDHQTQWILKTVERFGLDYAPLFVPA